MPFRAFVTGRPVSTFASLREPPRAWLKPGKDSTATFQPREDSTPTARVNGVTLYDEESGSGYPLSNVPQDPAASRDEILVEDLGGLMRHLGIERAHIGGLSICGNITPNFGIAHPDMSESLSICGCGSGTSGRRTCCGESR